MRLKCVATREVQERREAQAQRQVARPRQGTLKRGKTRSVEVELNKRGRRVLSDGDRVKVQVRSKDKQGNGWRSSKTVRLG